LLVAVLVGLLATARKRSLADDRRLLERLKVAFAANTPLTDITAGRIAEYKILRLKTKVRRHGEERDLSPGTLNRELAALRHLLRLALLDLVEFALFTGLRRGEALGLTWQRVDRARGVILLNVTKTNRRREVPLNSQADAVLARRGPKDAGPVFGTVNWDHFRSAWETAVERAQLTDFHFHDLRHRFASWAVQNGATLQEIKDLLGH
jgi:integrase